MLFLNVFKVTIWNSFILSIDFFFFFGSVNRFSESKIEYPVCIAEAGNG